MLDAAVPNAQALSTRTAWMLAVLLVLCSAVALSAAPARAGPVAGATPIDACTRTDGGRALRTTPLTQLSSTELGAELRQIGLPDTARYGIETFRVEYCTVATSGEPTTASGLLALPQAQLDLLPLVVYAHSTAAGKTDAPSFLTETDSRIVPFFFASDGFAVVAPDYLGLGISTGHHPYLHATTEASATLDLLRAADAVSHERGARLSHDVFLTGHSQGGHAAMAAGRALQQSHGPWRMAALAPMSGPLDLSGTESAAVLDPERTDPQHASVYMAYLFTAWKDLYGLYSDPREVFTAPYADIIEGLFDGTHGIQEIDAVLPVPEELFRPETLALIAHPGGRYAVALRDNDVCDWTPSAPVRLYHSRGDRDAVFANAEQCHRQMMAKGGTAQIMDMGPIDHVGTAVTSVPLIRTWFSHLRETG
jgi:pimeloyl-ACP methyl ester carboxylesterase